MGGYTVKGEQGRTEYHPLAIIDDQTIFADKEGYFLFEHCQTGDGGYYAIPVRLGKTAKEVFRYLKLSKERTRNEQIY